MGSDVNVKSVVRRAALAMVMVSMQREALAQSPPPLNPPVVDLPGAPGADGSAGSGQGSDAQPGGAGGTINGAAVGQSNQVSTTASGGQGGKGGDGQGITASGGNGGNGGDGGKITLRLNADASTHFVGARVFGGDGGVGGNIGSTFGEAGQSGNGGAGGSILFDALAGSSVDQFATNAAVSLTSRGGQGASGAFSYQFFNADGVNGGDGGDGGAILTGQGLINGTIESAGAAVRAVSAGGNGGDGGAAGSSVAEAVGGNGGAGGNGGTVKLIFGPQAMITAAGAAAPGTGDSIVIGDLQARESSYNPAISALSSGGSGGAGGEAVQGSVTRGGSGGAAGTGGVVAITTSGGALQTAGYAAPGIVGQSVGGGGGAGASVSGGLFARSGGSGGTGGAGSNVNIQTSGGSIATNGDASVGILGQSVGGGGGTAGDVTLISLGAGVAIGGSGGDGGGGADVSLINGFTRDSSNNPIKGSVITTTGATSPGMLGQSIAGGGGVGGSALSTVLGAFSLAIGGTGGAAGATGGTNVQNDGAIQTTGAHSAGMIAQSIGGGGGDGGWGTSNTVGAQYTAGVAVGGAGGSGGTGGTAEVNNAGQITTSGEDSFGVLAQSIGGGGGDGGDSLSRVFQLYNAPSIPSIAANVAVGGEGGSGNNAGAASITNSGAVLTMGTQGFGLVVQSIGGGGGDGGDAEDLNQSFKAANVSASVAVGGGGGVGGDGGQATVQNTGVVMTFDKGASGILAQSIGGGGGDGGAGSADTGSLSGPANKLTAQVTVSVGGAGNAGGNGGAVTVSSSGGILTRGDGAAGIYSQSIGGGGGNAGFGNALGSGGELNINVGVGGKGGAGGNGGTVTVTQSGAVLSSGGGAPAIFAQSVGGGGGNGGDAAAAGGTSPVTTVMDFIKEGLGIGLETEDSGNGVLALAPSAISVLSTLKGLVDTEDSYDKNNPQTKKPPPAEDAKVEMSVDVGGGFGGAGGAGGVGGAVNVANTGALQTNGPASDAILAQSVGGGGGDGGAANPSAGSEISVPSAVDLVIGVGGAGGSSGDGGAVSVTHTGTIVTTGDLSYGIQAQSIGGGGGDGGATVAQNGVLGDLTVSLGGSGGSSGDGQSVQLKLGDGAAQASITTGGRDSSAVLAQSIGGGGGLAYLMGSNFVGEGGTGRSGTGLSDGSMLPDYSLVSLRIDGAGGAQGNGGPVSVLIQGNTLLSTSGTNAYGIMAQSIGGGGGLVIGAKTDANTLANLYGGPLSGAANGGAVTVQLSTGAAISTSGAGAAGILAQSIGGGGGLIGGLSQVTLGAGPANNPRTRSGQGGDISITLAPGSSITTTGADAHGIFAQSGGGGAGVIGLQDGTGYSFSSANPYAGCSGDACTGDVTISTAGTVSVSGAGAWAIYAESRGNGSNNTSVTVNQGGEVLANPGAAGAVYIVGSGNNSVTLNNGAIRALGSGGVAIAGPQSATISNKGTIVGSIQLPTGASTVNNLTGGLIEMGSTIMLGAGGSLQNSGTVAVAGMGTIGTTTLTGAYTQAPGGILEVDVANASGRTDELVVNGSATLNGSVAVQALAGAVLAPHTTQSVIVSASGGVSSAGLSLATSSTPIVSYKLSQPDGNDLELTEVVDYKAAQAFASQNLLSSDRAAVGGALNEIESKDPPGFDDFAARLTQIPSAQVLATTYDGLSGQAVADAPQVALATHEKFSGQVLDAVGAEGLGHAPRTLAQMRLDDSLVGVSLYGADDKWRGTGGSSTLNSHAGGALLTFEHAFASWLSAGAAFGGGNANFSVRDLASSASQSSYEGALFATISEGRLYAKGLLGYGSYHTSETRAGLGTAVGLDASAQAAFDTHVLGSRLEAGWQQSWRSVTLTPYAAVEVDHLQQGGFSESALQTPATLGPGGLALSYAGMGQTSVSSDLGGRLSRAVPLSSARALVVNFDLGWEHHFSPSSSLQTQFEAAPGTVFTVQSLRRSANDGVTALSVSLPVTRSLTLNSSLSGQFSGSETSYGLMLGAAASF